MWAFQDQLAFRRAMPPPRPMPAWMSHSSERRRTTRKCVSFESIRDDCVASGELYEDPDFRAANSSLYYDKEPDRPITWMRPSEMSNNPQMFVEGASRFDVQQGELGNCWFLASLAALCGPHGSSPSTPNEQVQQVVLADNKLGPEGGGVVHFRIWHFGEWKEVIIDSRLPTVRGQLLYVHSADGDEFWSALLEKAYAKLYGSYQALDGGLPDEGLVDLTGGIVETFEFSEGVPDNLYSILCRAHKRSSLMVCNVLPPPGWDGDVLSTGLLPAHAYTVTSVQEIDLRGRKERLLRIRNPWGVQEWNGRWSDTDYRSRSLPAEERDAMGMLLKEDGEFWMCWEDFRAHYGRLQLCHLRPASMPSDTAETGATWASSQHRGAWKKFVSAGGCANHKATFWTNPQFRTEVVDPDDDDDEDLGTLIVSLMQIGMRRQRKEGRHFHTIGFSVYKLECPRQGLLGSDFFRSHRPVKNSKFADMREVCERFKLAPGHYVIVPSTFEPNEEAEFLLRIYSERPVEAAEMDEDMEEEPNEEAVDEDNVIDQRDVSPTGSDDSDEAASLPPDTREQTRSVWQQFRETAGVDWQVDAFELEKFLNGQFIQDLGFSRFKLDTCRSMVAMMDVSLSGKLSYPEFRDLWQGLTKWQSIFHQFDQDRSGTFNSYELRLALNATGYRVSNHTFLLLVARYAQPNGQIFFDDFVHCAVRLTTMTATYRKIYGAGGNPPTSKLPIDQFLQATMYS